MKETLVRFERGPSGKKYTAVLKDSSGKTRRVSFGAVGYGQWKDSTGLGLWSHMDHGDLERRRKYFSRHSAGLTDKRSAVKREMELSRGRYNAKILSHLFLW